MRRHSRLISLCLAGIVDDLSRDAPPGQPTVVDASKWK
jgi:hypothetical protein